MCGRTTYTNEGHMSLPRFRDPIKLPSRTEGKSVFPPAVHADLPDVPAFMLHHDEHFKPKNTIQPLSLSPRSRTLIAVLRPHGMDIGKILDQPENIFSNANWPSVANPTSEQISMEFPFGPPLDDL